MAGNALGDVAFVKPHGPTAASARAGTSQSEEGINYAFTGGLTIPPREASRVCVVPARRK